MICVENFEFATEENTTGSTLVMKGSTHIPTEGNGIVFKWVENFLKWSSFDENAEKLFA